MGAEFPIPRDQLPQIRVSEVEHDARKLQMERMLLQTLAEFDRMRDVTTDATHVDPLRWERMGTRKGLVAFRERSCSVLAQYGGAGMAATPATVASSAYSAIAVGAGDDDEIDTDHLSSDAMLLRGSSWRQGVGGRRRSLGSLTGGIIGNASLTTSKPDPPSANSSVRGILMVGEMPGRVENALYAVVAKSQNEMALVTRFVHDDIADSRIMHTMEAPSRSRPYHFLGYKWLVKKPARFVKYRDTFYIEYTGLTTTSQGEPIGFHIMHGVEHPDFPLLTDRHCLRSMQSLRFLYRQRHENVIEVYMAGEMDFPGGRLLRPLVTALSTDVLLGVWRLTDCAEAKRLSKMVIQFRHARDQQLYAQRDKITACTLCQQRKKFYNTVTLLDCTVCGQFVCARCRMQRHMYISDGALGRYERVRCCRACIIMANKVHTVTVKSTPGRKQSSASSSTSSSTRRPPHHSASARQLRRRSSIQDGETSSSSRQRLESEDQETRTHRSSSDSSLITAEMAQVAIPLTRGGTGAGSNQLSGLDMRASGLMAQNDRKEYAYLETGEDSGRQADGIEWAPAGRDSLADLASTSTGSSDEKPVTVTVTMGPSASLASHHHHQQHQQHHRAASRQGGGLFQQTLGMRSASDPRMVRRRSPLP